jgi:hypothetical protein
MASALYERLVEFKRENDNERGNYTHSCSSVEEEASCDEEDSKPPLVPTSELMSSDPDQEVAREDATTDDIPFSWTLACHPLRTKF